MFSFQFVSISSPEYNIILRHNQTTLFSIVWEITPFLNWWLANYKQLLAEDFDNYLPFKQQNANIAEILNNLHDLLYSNDSIISLNHTDNIRWQYVKSHALYQGLQGSICPFIIIGLKNGIGQVSCFENNTTKWYYECSLIDYQNFIIETTQTVNQLKLAAND